MLIKFYLWIRKKLFGIDDRSVLEVAISRGMKIGMNCNIQENCTFDLSHCWLIEIGNNVTFAPRVNLIAHDASTKRILDYTLIGHIYISDNVFIGAGATVLPNVTIGENSIIGAGSIITHDILPNVVVAGNPAKVLMSLDEYINKRKGQFKDGIQFDYSYTIDGGITEEQKNFMKRKLKKNIGSIV